MITAPQVHESLISHRRSALRDTVLSASLGERDLARLEGLGEILAIPSGTALWREGDPSDHLHVVLDGAVLPAGNDRAGHWVGPGDVCGEIGFVLGTRRSSTMIAMGPAPRVFRVHRDALAHVGGSGGAAVTRMLAAAARVVRSRLDPQASSCAGDGYVDPHHPSVDALAQRLVRRTPFETACAIWSFVWAMPYRFGSWQWSASDTLARKHGMCTTKAILQIALMKAVGIEGGYVKTLLQGELVRALMPRAYHPRFDRPTFKHYYAAAKIDGRWIPLDASFSRASLALISETVPYVRPFVDWDALEGGNANGGATLGGTDPFAIEVHTDLSDVMRKSPSYDAKNADAMNVLLDRAQGFVPDAPPHVARMEEALASGEHLAARCAVFDGLANDAATLRARRAPNA